jgi:4Fe-4S ferredoxin
VFPRYKRQKEEQTIKYGAYYPSRRFELHHDLEKCATCTVCSTVCPTGAIRLGPFTVTIDAEKETLPLVIDPTKCVWCGVCDHFCPFVAIQLHVDGQHDNILARKQALPTLDSKFRIVSKHTVYDRYIKYSYARGYFEGQIVFHPANCPSDCVECSDACPVGAIELIRNKAQEGGATEITINESKCTLCGACVHVCKITGAIELTRKYVRSTGEYTEIWDKTVKKLTEKITS